MSARPIHSCLIASHSGAHFLALRGVNVEWTEALAVDFNGLAVDDRGAADECVGAAEMLGSSSAAHPSSWVAGLNVASSRYAA